MEPHRLRDVERLAYRMYKADAPNGTPWVRRGWTVREAWLKKAQKKLESAGGRSDRHDGWWNAWGIIKAVRS